MFAINAQALPLLEAAKLTFSPEGRCEICSVVSKAKQQQENSATVPAANSTRRSSSPLNPRRAPSWLRLISLDGRSAIHSRPR